MMSVAPIPADGGFGWDNECAGMKKWNFDFHQGTDLREEFVLKRLRILDEESIVDLKEELNREA